jgi:hypothetical protein
LQKPLFCRKIQPVESKNAFWKSLARKAPGIVLAFFPVVASSQISPH